MFEVQKCFLRLGCKDFFFFVIDGTCPKGAVLPIDSHQFCAVQSSLKKRLAVAADLQSGWSGAPCTSLGGFLRFVRPTCMHCIFASSS